MSKKNKKGGDKALSRLFSAVLSGATPLAEAAETLTGLGLTEGDQAALGGLAQGVQTGRIAASALSGAPPELIDAVVRALAEREALTALTALTEAPDKAVRRAAAGALHRMAAAGVAVPERKTAAPLVQLGTEAPLCLLTAIDGSGTRLLYLYMPTEGLGHRIIVREDGFFDLDSEESTRGAMEKEAASFTDSTGLPHAEVPAGHALRVLKAGVAGASASGRPVDLDTQRLLRELGRAGPALPALSDALEEVEPLVGEQTDPKVMRLLMGPESGTWTLVLEEMRASMELLSTSQESKLVVSEALETERQSRVMRQAAALAFTPGHRARYAARLEETAALLEISGRAEDAATAAGCAAALRDDSIPTERIPFVSSLFMTSLVQALQEMGVPPKLQSELEDLEAELNEEDPDALLVRG